MVEAAPGALSSLNGDMRPVRRARGVSAVQQVYEGIRHPIIDLTLPPGSPITKSEITAAFGVSQTPVREALLRLENEGLVDIFPQSRTVVSLIDIQHAREVHFLRLGVEIEVMRVLMKCIETEGMDELRTWIERQTTELNSGNHIAFKRADDSFHQEMFHLAGVQGLASMIDSKRGHYDRIRGLYLLEQQRREIVIEEHRAIVSALEARDPVAAEAAVRQHLGKSLAIIEEIRERHPGYFL